MPQKNIETDSLYAKIIRGLFYALFFLTPLILWTKTSEVFEFNKMLFVYLSTIAIASTWLLKSVQEKKFTLRRTPLDIPILIFLISQILSTILSIDPHTSFWGYYSRFHGGLASTLSYIVLFYALVTHFSDKSKSIANLIYTILVSGLVVSVYGVLEHYGIDKDVWVQDVQNRVFSTLGQPNWLSAYLVAILPIPFLSTFSQKNRLYSYLYGSLTFLIFITILFTKSRSGIGATVITITLSLIYLLYRSIRSKKKIFPLLLLSFSLLLSTFLIGSPWTPNPGEIQKTLSVGGPLLPAFEKYLNQVGLSSQLKPLDTEKLSDQEKWQVDLESKGIRVGGSNSMEIRSIVWKGAVELGKRRPFFGYGLETFGYTYYNVRPEEHNLVSEWDFLYNKAHNEYLNLLANAGLIGLLSYLLLIAAIFKVFLTSLIKEENPLHTALLLGFISILITNYFGFSVVCIALFFFLFPAIVISSNEESKKEMSLKIKFPTTTATLVVFFLLYSSMKLFTTWSADIAYAGGKSLSQYGPTYLSDAIEYLTTAVKTNKNEPLYKSILAESQAQAALYLSEQLKVLEASTPAQTKDKFAIAIDEFTQAALTNSAKALEMNPHHTNYYKSRAKVGIYLSSIDPVYYNDVITTLLKVSELAPTDAKSIYNLGLVYLNMGKNEESIVAFQKAIDLKPDYTEAQVRLSSLMNPQEKE